MSYKALLFCPEEKTARVVTQVLSELDFQVEPCNEPFAAVKRLMAEHFDAVVVDCENEQNATLLFRSARNSGSNQTSLSVAVVEGQSGVAKAFRIGANLVLTKPINVEQSKGTLRVARGLLRKTDTSRTTGQPASIESPSHAAATSAAKPEFPSTNAPTAMPVFTSAPSVPAVPAPVASAGSQFELDAEPELKPEPAEAALLESMPDPLGDKGHSASASTPAAPGKQSPWQPVAKTMAEPMASALQHAADATGKSAADSAEGKSKSTGDLSSFQAGRPVLVSSHGAAAAPAPAKEKLREAEEVVPTEIEPPTFATFGKASSSQPGGSKKIIAITAIVLMAAAAGYFGWRKIGVGGMTSFLHKPGTVHAPAATSAPPAVTTQPSAVPQYSLHPIAQKSRQPHFPLCRTRLRLQQQRFRHPRRRS